MIAALELFAVHQQRHVSTVRDGLLHVRRRAGAPPLDKKAVKQIAGRAHAF